MVLDITEDFRKYVQDLRSRKTEQGQSGLDLTAGGKARPLVPSAGHVQKAKQLRDQVTELRDLLLEHRRAYLNMSISRSGGGGGGNVPGDVTSDSMSDADRDRMDATAQIIVKSVKSALLDLKRDVYSHEASDQASEHCKAVLDLVESYLNSVCKIFTEMKAVRVKWTVELERMGKLETTAVQKAQKQRIQNTSSAVSPESLEGSTFKSSTLMYSDQDENPLSEEELQMFEMENEQLYNELNSLSNEVESIQSKVLKIAELQEVFTEKVLQQNEDIERISTTIVGTTENVKDANQQIREAIQSNVSFRVYVLFFIIVMSLSLLFLDWYND